MFTRNIKILVIIFLLVPAMLCAFAAPARADSIPFLGEIRLFAFDFVPNDGVWVSADGQTLSIGQYSSLFSLIGTTYGGDGQSAFAVPNLNGAGSANPWGAGKGRYVLAANGEWPNAGTSSWDTVHPYLGEIRLFAFSTIPKGWLECRGQLLSVSQNGALVALLSNSYGGNGSTTFALPDLRGLEPVPGSRYCINTDGYWPSSASNEKNPNVLPTVYTGEVRLFAIPAGYSAYTPLAGWLRCNGQSFSTSTYPRLSSLLGTMYGGSGITPNLDGGSNPANPWVGTYCGTYCIVADEQYAVFPARP